MHKAREKKTHRDVLAYEITDRGEALKRISLICWRCESAVDSVGGYTKRNGSAYKAHFRLAQNTDHEAGCPLNPIAVITAIAHGAQGLAQVDAGILHLTLPKDLTELTPPAPPLGSEAEPVGITTRHITTVRPLLPPLISSAAKIARFLQLHDFDPDIVKRFRVLPHGRKRPVAWEEFCYGPTPESYAALYERRRSNKPSTHPIALYGTVERIAHEGKSGRPYAVLATDVPTGTARFDVLLRSAFDTLVTPLEVGMHVLAVGDWEIFPKSRIPQLRLFAADHWQVAYWSADEESGKATEPTCPPPVTARQRVIAKTEERARRPKTPQRPGAPRSRPAAAQETSGPTPAAAAAAAVAPDKTSSPPPSPAPPATDPQQPTPTGPEENGDPPTPPAPAALPRPKGPPRPELWLPPSRRRRGLGHWFGRRK